MTGFDACQQHSAPKRDTSHTLHILIVDEEPAIFESFDLLACLLAAPGRVFTRAELIDRVWGDGFAITDRTIDSHVKGLRRKVETAGGNPGLIETVRGVGYRVTDKPVLPSRDGASETP